MTDTPIRTAAEALIDRLMTPAVATARGYCDVDLPLDPLREQAAATLSALLAENAAVRAEYKEMLIAKDIHAAKRAEYFARAEAAEAENAAVRAKALEDAAKACVDLRAGGSTGAYARACSECADAIRAMKELTP